MGPITQIKKLAAIKDNTAEVVIKIAAIAVFVLAVILAIVCAALVSGIVFLMLYYLTFDFQWNLLLNQNN